MSIVEETEREGPIPAGEPTADGTPRAAAAAKHKSRATRAGRAPSVPRVADMTAMVRLVARLPVDGKDAADRRRRLLAELCRVVGAHMTGAGGRTPSVADGLALTPRLRQTLELLVAGDSERQVALKLKISQHTVHVYVKQLYKRFGVSSRGELLARFVRGTGGGLP